MNQHNTRDLAQELLNRTAQINRLIECIAEKAHNNPTVHDALHGVIVLAGQSYHLAGELHAAIERA